MVVAGCCLQRTARAYELSSRGALFRYLRRSFDDLYFSEYFDDVSPGEMKGDIPCQDVQSLQLQDRRFDLVTCTEVFEHVPDDRRGFAEIFRVLQPGGHFVFTVPLMPGRETLERARIGEDGAVVHLVEPEYHSDVLRGSGRVLAFRTYGGDIVERLRDAGFVAELRRIDSERSCISGQYVVTGRKP